MLFYIVLAVHLLLCITLVGLVLIQQGKGADMGAAFGGGGSNTFFGAAGATAFITKLTTGIAIAFMVTSILLINLYTAHTRSGTGLFSGPNKVQQLLDSDKAPVEAPPSAVVPQASATAQPSAPQAVAPAPAPVANSSEVAPPSIPQPVSPAP